MPWAAGLSLPRPVPSEAPRHQPPHPHWPEGKGSACLAHALIRSPEGSSRNPQEDGVQIWGCTGRAQGLGPGWLGQEQFLMLLGRNDLGTRR